MHDVPNSFIKGVAFELPEDFQYDHAPWDKKNNNLFVGRKAEQEKFLSMLKSKNKKGVYMVTGYRGMGKTSFVNRVIDNYKKNEKEPNNVEIVNVHISAPNTNEIDILRHITSQLKAIISRHSYTADIIKILEWIQKTIIAALVILLSILIIFPYVKYTTLIYTLIKFENKLNSYLSLDTCLLLAVLYTIVVLIKERFNNRNNDPYNSIEILYNKAYSTISTEKNQGLNIPISESLIGSINFLKQKKTQSYPIASSKELEEELINILGQIKNPKNRTKIKDVDIIFIFDELDKVSLKVQKDDYYADLDTFKKEKADGYATATDENRNRKAVIINILGNLKSLFTRADARFIFIAGREMFDAALADVSDRQSLLSSIFNHIFYLDSFMKERSGTESFDNQYGITDLIEEYLISTICQDDKEPKTLEAYYKKLTQHTYIQEDVVAKKQRKAIFVLQKLIVYLTYRSNGSPKKLQKALESFIKVTSHPINCHKNIVIGRDYKIKSERTNQHSTCTYLDISYDDQYRIGFINYLFRPYIINKSTSLTTLSDNTLVTTPYIMDHLIKFHPFAFSQNSLEQIPEVLSSSSTQAHREYIKSLVEYLSLNHIRSTHVNLFSYKFISKSENELNYITLKFEEEAAAFNFTLDESFNIKLNIRRKIKELRSIFPNITNDTKQIYSLSFLNGWVGDTHFFDQEYDDAITHYSDSIKDITNLKYESLNFRDFALLINFKLKLGLCLEKIKSFDDAIGFYTDAINNTKGFIKKHTNTENDNIFSTSAISDFLQVVNQSFIAKAYLQEKMSFSGFDVYKAKHNLLSFEEILVDIYRCVPCNNYLTLANYYLNIGNLFYYKNVYACKSEINNIINSSHFFSFALIKGYFLTNDNDEYNLGFVYYVLSLLCVKRYLIFEEKEENKSIKYLSVNGNDIYELISTVYKNCRNKNQYANRITAMLFSSIGNCFAQNIHKRELTREYIKDALNISFSTPEHKIDIIINELKGGIHKNLTFALSLYRLSADYYSLTGTKISVTWQYRKALYLVRSTISVNSKIDNNNDELNSEIIDIIDTKIVSKLLNLNVEISDVSDKKQYLKYLKTFDKLGKGKIIDKDFKNHIDTNLSNHPEDMEVLLLFFQIAIKLKIDRYKHVNIIDNYNSIATQYSRVGELLFEEHRCLNKLEAGEINDKILVDYFFACLSIIRICDILTLNMMLSNSFIGTIYYKIGCAINKYLNQDNIKPVTIALNNHLKENPYTLADEAYFYRKAKLFFGKAKSLHCQGKEYTNLLNVSVYLEDTFNDNSNHFGLCLERFFINTGVIDETLSMVDIKIDTDANKISTGNFL